MDKPVIQLIGVLDLKHSKRWINLVYIFEATGSIEKTQLCSHHHEKG